MIVYPIRPSKYNHRRKMTTQAISNPTQVAKHQYQKETSFYSDPRHNVTWDDIKMPIVSQNLPCCGKTIAYCNNNQTASQIQFTNGIAFRPTNRWAFWFIRSRSAICYQIDCYDRTVTVFFRPKGLFSAVSHRNRKSKATDLRTTRTRDQGHCLVSNCAHNRLLENRS